MSHWQADEVAHKSEGGYPEQRHAGAVGLGPEYGKGAVNTLFLTRQSWIL